MKFAGTLCGVIDVYAQLATILSRVQKVEQFSWEMINTLKEGIKTLRLMAEVCNLERENGDGDAHNAIFQRLFPRLSSSLNDLKHNIFHGEAGVHLVSVHYRVTRAQNDCGDTNYLKTVENQNKSLCNYQANFIEVRTIKNEQQPYSELFLKMKGCLDLNAMYHASQTPNFYLNDYGISDLKKLLAIACVSDQDRNILMCQYEEFKRRFLEMVASGDSRFLKCNEHHLFKIHQCTKECKVKNYKSCPHYQKVTLPKIVITMKFLHLFLQDKELYTGIEGFLHFFLRCACKTHAEGVAESMGSHIEIHCEKHRGLDIETVGNEAFIH